MNERLNRFLGDSPLRVVLRLVILSFAVGVVLAALGLEPADIVVSAVRFVRRLWAMGFSALDRAWGYFLIGAIVVVPIWILLRLVSFGKR